MEEEQGGEGEGERGGGSKRGRDAEGEAEAAVGEGPLKQAKVAEAQAASGAASGAASACESMEEGSKGPKDSKASGSLGDTETSSEADTGPETAAGAGSCLEGASLRVGEWQVVELQAAELTCDQMHFCDACGKGFKREANLRMHMKAHGHAHVRDTTPRPALSPVDPSQCRFSCPVAGCKRHRGHAAFQPLKTVLCVRNHYRRSHCPKLLACSRCGGAKRFAVLADLRTHEKHCGQTSWVCSCGSCFSRKDKLMAHLVSFIGHSAVSPRNNRA